MPLAYYFLIPVLCFSSCSDWKERRIPNKLLFPAFILAVVLNYVSMGPDGLLLSFSGTGLGFLLLFIPFLLGGLGAGDLKLLMVIGSFGGPALVLGSFLIGAVLGGFLAVVFLLYRWNCTPCAQTIPYGIPLSLGTAIFIILEYWR